MSVNGVMYVHVFTAMGLTWCDVCAGIYCYGTHLVVTVDIMGIIVKKDIRDKLIIYARKYVCFFTRHLEQKIVCQ